MKTEKQKRYKSQLLHGVYMELGWGAKGQGKVKNTEAWRIFDQVCQEGELCLQKCI